MRFLRPQTTVVLDWRDRDRMVEAIKWAWFERVGYRPHAGQMKFHKSLARHRVVNAGTRGGKSRCVGEEMVVPLLIGACRVWLVGQNYQFCEKEFRYIHDRIVSREYMDIYGVGSLEKCVYNEKGGDMQIRTVWGSEVKCISLENREGAGAFGEEVDYLVLCEPGQIKYPKRVWERVLYGRLASRHGRMVCAGTPSGRVSSYDPDGWFYELVERGLRGDDPDYYSVSWASWDNPAFTEDVEEIRRWMSPKVFEEQYEGKFVVFSGAIYDNFDEGIHIVPSGVRYPLHWRRFEAIDPGYSGEFYWLAGVVGYGGELYIVDEYFASKRTYEEHADEIWRRRMGYYGLRHRSLVSGRNYDLDEWKGLVGSGSICDGLVVYIDPEDRQCVAEFAKYGIFGVPADNDVHVGIDRVRSRLGSNPPKLYISEGCSHLIEAIGNHSWGEHKGIGTRMPANDKYKHACDALRYICMGNLGVSVERVERISRGETMDDILNSLVNDRHPFEYDRYDRRRMVYGGLY